MYHDAITLHSLPAFPAMPVVREDLKKIHDVYYGCNEVPREVERLDIILDLFRDEHDYDDESCG